MMMRPHATSAEAPLGFDPPPMHRRAPVHAEAIDCETTPVVWLMGAHGGAGVTTLCRRLGFAGDCHRAFPGGHAGQSPFVVIVATETETGLSAAHDRLVQHRAGAAGPSVCLGLVTRPAAPGWDRKPPAAIRRKLDLVTGAAAASWRIGWDDECLLQPLNCLASVTPALMAQWRITDQSRRRRGDGLDGVGADVLDLASDLIADIGRHSN